MRTRFLSAVALAYALASSAVAQGTIPPRTTNHPAARYVDAERAARLAKLVASSTATLRDAMHYTLEVDAAAKTFTVTLEVDVTEKGALCFAMPAWAPGSYHIVNNGKNIETITFETVFINRVRKLKPRREDNQWHLANVPVGALRVRYTIPARRFRQRVVGRRQHKIADRTYQVAGPKLWMYEVRHTERPCRVTMHLPKAWDVATGLAAAPNTIGGNVRPGEWRFVAPDYDVLADCPAKLGAFESFAFRVGKTPFEIALAGGERQRTSRQEFAARVRRISKYFVDFFGGAPFQRYVYLLTIPGGGGLEHLNSTAIGLMGLHGSRPGKPVIWDLVLAHEFFHAWNVKRLRPRALGPFDYSGPNRTTALWFSEGVTSYYAALAMPRIGLWSAQDYWRHIGRKFSTLRGDRRRKIMSVADSSWKVWDGSYMGSDRRIDYYLKGECLGALLDVLIREASGNKRSFDDVLRQLYAQTSIEGIGFDENDIRATCEEIAGRDFEEFFRRYVYGTEDLPVETVLPKAGMHVDVSGTERRPKLRLSEDPKARPLARRIRASWVGPVKP